MIFVETHTYTLTKTFGRELGLQKFEEQLAAPDDKSLPCVRQIARLRTIDECVIWNDGGATNICEARSRAFHAALETMKGPNDVWFSLDDDCECTLDATQWLVDAVHFTHGICFAPYWARTSERQGPFIVCNVPPLKPGEERQFRPLFNGGKVTPAVGSGMGLLAVHVDAVRRIAECNESPTYVDIEGVRRRALFLPFIAHGNTWMFDDRVFFSKVPPDVIVEALVTGVTMHAGERLDLRIVGMADDILKDPSKLDSLQLIQQP